MERKLTPLEKFVITVVVTVVGALLAALLLGVYALADLVL